MSEATAPVEPVVLVEDLGPVRRLTMNRPNALNALNGELIDGLSEAIRAAGNDPDVSVVILRGAGRAFCAGYDLNEDAEGGEHDARHWHEELAGSTEKMLELTDQAREKDDHRLRRLLDPGRGKKRGAVVHPRGARPGQRPRTAA